MKTVGEILRRTRIEKKFTFEDVEKATKIRKKFLISLEENDWDKLPSLPYIKGFIRNYSLYLGLTPEEMVAIFRRHFKEKEKAGLIPSGLTHPLDERVFTFTPQTTLIAILGGFIILFSGYLIYQYKAYTSPPELSVISPKEGEIILESKIRISGKTDTDAVISINNEKIALSANGEFSTSVIAVPGVNTVSIESTSKYGKKRTVTRTVKVEENADDR